MLSKKQRLTKKDFPFKPARRAVFAFGTCAYAPGPSRAAVVVSKKIAPHAVTRNRIRRRVYAALRPLLPKNASVIIFPNKKALDASVAELRAALTEALH